MKTSDRKIMEIRALAEASTDALIVVAKASQDRQAKLQESRKVLAKVSSQSRTR